MAVTTESITVARKAGKAMGPRIVFAPYRRAGGELKVEYENGVMLAVPVALIYEFALLETAPSTTDVSRINTGEAVMTFTSRGSICLSTGPRRSKVFSGQKHGCANMHEA